MFLPVLPTAGARGPRQEGVSEALIAGERDPVRMADLAQKRLRNKIPQLTEALVGRFNEHHAFPRVPQLMGT